MRIYLIISTLLILAVVNWSIYQKQQILQNGEVVYLKLAAYDPRSLMQGDYLRFGYALEQNLPPAQKNQVLLIALDAQHIGSSARFAPIGDIQNHERVFHTNKAGNQIMPNSFLFKEGDADLYQNAQYAVFYFAKGSQSRYVLRALADAKRRIINPHAIAKAF